MTDLFIQALCVIERDLRDDAQAAIDGMALAYDRWHYLLETAAPTRPGDNRFLLWLDA